MIAPHTQTSLSQEQQAILTYWMEHLGPVLVRASAGSGKTRLLTACIQGLLSVERTNYRVLCLTFSTKAADEMKERVADIPEIDRRSYIGTIHSFGMEVLQAYYHEIGFFEMPHIIERPSDCREIMQKVFLENASLRPFYLQSLEAPRGSGGDEFIDKWLRFVSQAKQKLVYDPESTEISQNWNELRLLLFQDYHQRLRNQNLMDFDDILVLAWRLLTERPGVAKIYRRLYPYVLVDEAQDLNFAQYEFIRGFCGDDVRNILFVGDEKQSIYGFNGGSNRFMLQRFPEDFSVSEERQFRIRKNYRSSKAVIESGNKIIPDAADASSAFFEGEVAFRAFADEQQEGKWILRKINELLGLVENEEFGGKLSLDNIAVIARNKFVFNALRSLLDQDEHLKDKYYLRRGAEPLLPESTFMFVFDLGTRLLMNKFGAIYQDQLKRRLGLAELVTNGRHGIEFLEDLASNFRGVEVLTQQELQSLLPCWQAVANGQYPRLFQLLRRSAESLSNENEKQLAYHDVEEWQDAWKTFTRSVEASTISFAGFQRFVATHGRGSRTPENKITLSTVHTVKGLEYHVVFLIGMSQGTFPDYRSLQGTALEEERNNAYVAVTRAKRRLYISYPKSKIMPWGSTRMQQPSVFLTQFETIQEVATDSHIDI